MWQLRQALNFALGLLGAIVLAAAVAAVPAGADHYFRAALAKLLDFARLDFGTSKISGAAAIYEIASRLPATLELMLVGGVIALIVGAPLGLVLGRGRLLRAAAPLIQIVAAAPVFCAALALLWIAANVLHWHYVPQPLPWPALFEGGPHSMSALLALSLPGLTVGAAGAAVVQLAVRRAEAEAMRAPYRRGLALMGLGSLEIDRLYLLPQVVAGLLANLGEIVLALISATAVAEWLFGWPGAAVLFLKSVALHDWNVTAVVLLVFAAIALFAELCGRLCSHALGSEASW